MDMWPGAPTTKPKARWKAYLYLSVLLIVLMPILAKVFGFAFIPAPDWLALAHLPGLVTGVVFAALMLWLTISARHRLGAGWFKTGITILMSPLFGFWIGYVLVVVSGPMLLAVVAGHETQLNLTVSRADRSGSSRCRMPVEFEGLIFAFDRVCDIPDDFRQLLAPADPLTVVGRGTRFGLIAERLRLHN